MSASPSPSIWFRIPASKDAAKVERMVASTACSTTAFAALTGVLYPVSAFPMSSEDWKDHFGRRWPLLHDAKRRYDPLGTLTPGYNVF
jgi:cytokinin dehydrogenase